MTVIFFYEIALISMHVHRFFFQERMQMIYVSSQWLIHNYKLQIFTFK